MNHAVQTIDFNIFTPMLIHVSTTKQLLTIVYYWQQTRSKCEEDVSQFIVPDKNVFAVNLSQEDSAPVVSKAV